MITVTETVTKTAQDLKAKYEFGWKEKLSHERFLKVMGEEFVQVQMQVLENSNNVRLGLKRLSEIALRDDALSHVDYIDQETVSSSSGTSHV